ncbi:MAG: hypothetical protein II418_07505 [Firmicutes bacterium]|nr:hypothetical protein [Bacillota bacterium]
MRERTVFVFERSIVQQPDLVRDGDAEIGEGLLRRGNRFCVAVGVGRVRVDADDRDRPVFRRELPEGGVGVACLPSCRLCCSPSRLYSSGVFVSIAVSMMARDAFSHVLSNVG